jgi:hypothetical protein
MISRNFWLASSGGNLIGAPQIGDVVQHEHRTASRRDHGSDPGDERAIDIACDRQLETVRLFSVEHAPQLIDDAGVANGFEIRVIDCVVVNVQHPPRSVVDVLEPALIVHDQNAFDHAGENGDHAGAVTRQIIDTPAELVDGGVHRARDLADFVVAVVWQRTFEIADGVALGDGQDSGHASLERGGQ